MKTRVITRELGQYRDLIHQAAADHWARSHTLLCREADQLNSAVDRALWVIELATRWKLHNHPPGTERLMCASCRAEAEERNRPYLTTTPGTRTEFGPDGVTFTDPDGTVSFSPYPAGEGGDDA